MKKIRKRWIALAAVLAACEGGTELQIPEFRVEAATLEARGDTAHLTARSDGVPAVAEWESLDPQIVAVTQAGVATAVAPGVARVQASLAGAMATGTVTVLPPVEIRLSDLAVVTDPSGQLGFRMRIENLGGRGFYRLELWRWAPGGGRERIGGYTSEFEAEPGMDMTFGSFLGTEIPDWVVAYAREPLAQEPVRTGCTWMAPESGVCPGDLPDPPVVADSVTLSPLAAVFNVGDTIQYVARAFAGGVELIGRTVVWSTPSPGIIALSETGRAVALRPGYGQVNVSVDGVSTSAALTVSSEAPEAPVGMVRVTPMKVRLWVGQAWNYAASVYDTALQPLAGRPVSWSVEDTTVARAHPSGMVIALGHGSTRVAATAGGKSGYATVESYARPENSAELKLRGLISAGADPNTMNPSIPTTWEDSAGVSHAAWIQVGPGTLSMQWDQSGGSYTQRLTLTTYVYDNPGVRKVAESEYRDSGSLEWWYDWTTGEQGFDFHSQTRNGLDYTARWGIPGELVLDQPLGQFSARKFYFGLSF